MIPQASIPSKILVQILEMHPKAKIVSCYSIQGAYMVYLKTKAEDFPKKCVVIDGEGEWIKTEMEFNEANFPIWVRETLSSHFMGASFSDVRLVKTPQGERFELMVHTRRGNKYYGINQSEGLMRLKYFYSLPMRNPFFLVHKD